MSNNKAKTLLLQWSRRMPAGDVADPLGLGLRASTRLASRLLFCITSITPRARYFSFLPWCIRDWQQRERGSKRAFGLREAIALRERALTLACIVHHEGKPCDGGSLVGSLAAGKWYAKGQTTADLTKLSFSKNPALGAYFNSLVNLGVFITEDDSREDSDEEAAQDQMVFDDIELSDLGLRLAEGYGQGIDSLSATKSVAGPHRTVDLADLELIGELGGLCELRDPSAPDRELLRTVFLAEGRDPQTSHAARRHTLLLLMNLCRQLTANNRVFSEKAFAEAVYYGCVTSDDGDITEVHLKGSLLDAALRWRLFYFHHYMAVALEGLFAWTVTEAAQHGVAGVTIDGMTEGMRSESVRRELENLLDIDLAESFAAMTPRTLLSDYVAATRICADSSQRLDEQLSAAALLGEIRLERLIREGKFILSPTGLALALTLLSVTLARYKRWDDGPYGRWLANASNDPYLDLAPPVLTLGLERQFGNWWDTPFTDIARFVISRYVVQQHQSISYEKTATGDRCLIQIDDNRVMAEAPYEKIGMGNPRIGSAFQILSDLALLIDNGNGGFVLTADGAEVLEKAMSAERP